MLIDTTGQVIFDGTNYLNIEVLQDSLVKVFCPSGHVGVASPSGKLVLDTIYKALDEFNYGKALVYGNHDYTINGPKEIGLIDEHFKWLIPFGKFENINPFTDADFTMAEVKDRDLVIINEKGQILHRFPPHSSDYGQCFSEGLIGIALPSKEGKEKCLTFFNAYGQRQFKLPKGDKASPFVFDRSLAGDYENYYLINKKGSRISSKRFSRIRDFNTDGEALVKDFDSGKWGLIDKNGHYLIPPTFEELLFEGWKGDIFWGNMGSRSNPKIVSINRKGEKINSYQYHYIKIRSGTTDYVYVEFGDSVAYMNNQGQHIWTFAKEESQYAPYTDTLNISHLSRAFFYAHPNSSSYSRNNPDFNPLKEDAAQLFKFPKQTLGLNVTAQKQCLIDEHFAGLKAYLYNTTDQLLELNSIDGLLYIITEAKNQDGQWQEINYIPSSWCGNSYGMRRMPPQCYWEFKIPLYQGTIPTSFRLKLMYSPPKRWEDMPGYNYRVRENDMICFYSNTFEGAVNPGQFWFKRPKPSYDLGYPYYD